MLTKLEQLQLAVLRQKEWIDSCGGTLAGYIAKYGSRENAEHSGNGGEAIFDADVEELCNLKFKLDRAIHRARKVK